MTNGLRVPVSSCFLSRRTNGSSCGKPRRHRPQAHRRDVAPRAVAVATPQVCSSQAQERCVPGRLKLPTSQPIHMIAASSPLPSPLGAFSAAPMGEFARAPSFVILRDPSVCHGSPFPCSLSVRAPCEAPFQFCPSARGR